jgi:hypothetical protein
MKTVLVLGAVFFSALGHGSDNGEMTLQSVFAAYKLKQRRACHQSPSEVANLSPLATEYLSAPDEHNQLRGFLKSGDHQRTLEEMERQQLQSALLEKIPWSGDYWPYSLGLLGNRFFDPSFTQNTTWKERYDFVQDNPAFELVETEKESLSTSLSVSEKYDYLSGDVEFALTEQMWAKGKAIYDEHGEVEDWMGLCHGWAASAIVMNKPNYTVTMRSYDDQNAVVFFPDEIKALSSYSWAEARYPTVFTGRRCNEDSPEDRDQFPECQDLNPSTWHQIVVAQIGQYKESFVMDATYDSEVWNHPVFAYSYEYFHPRDFRRVNTWREAEVSLTDFDDPYAKYRSPAARSLVGIQMRVGIVIETEASTSEQEPELKKRVLFVDYTYDLELDANDNIVGGEWYAEEHPDFVWKPAPGATDRNVLDDYVDASDLSTERPLTENWRYVVQRAASVGYVVPSLVHFLIEKSQVKN